MSKHATTQSAMSLIAQTIANNQTIFGAPLVTTPTDADINAFGKVFSNSIEAQNAFYKELRNVTYDVTMNIKEYLGKFAMFSNVTETYADMIRRVVVQRVDVNAYEYDATTDVTALYKDVETELLASYTRSKANCVYTVTLPSKQTAVQAFTSVGALTEFIDRVILARMITIAMDNDQLVKAQIGRNILDGMYKAVNPGTDSILEKFREYGSNFTCPGAFYNTGGYEMAFTDVSDQIIIMTSKMAASIDVSELALAFNLEKADFQQRRIVIDSFANMENARLTKMLKDSFVPFTEQDIAALEKVQCVLCDKDLIQVFSNYEGTDVLHNPYTGNDKEITRVEKLVSFNPFANVIVFADVTPSITSLTVTPAAATVSKGQQHTLAATIVAVGFASQKVEWSCVGTGVTVDAFGTVSVSGLATVGETATVTATSVFDPTKTDTCVITVA